MHAGEELPLEDCVWQVIRVEGGNDEQVDQGVLPQDAATSVSEEASWAIPHSTWRRSLGKGVGCSLFLWAVVVFPDNDRSATTAETRAQAPTSAAIPGPRSDREAVRRKHTHS
jgi:hypothetical protein